MVGIECTSSQSVSKDTVFQAKHNSHCLSSSSLLGASPLYVFLSTVIQMVSRGFTSGEFASRSPFAIKFQILLTPCLHVRRLFRFKAFQPLLVVYLHTLVLETLILWSWSFFTFLSWRFITHILTAFSITFLTHLKKDGHTLLGFSSKVFTFDHLFTYIIQTLVNSLTISLTEWPENQKNRCLSFSANSVGLHFRDRVVKFKENGKKTKIENLQNGQEKYGAKKLSYVHIWAKTSKVL